MFYLVRLDRDGDGNLVEMPLPDYGTFDKGADAAKASKVAAAATGAKVQCRRIAQAGDWRAAMLKRLEGGELSPLPAEWDVEPIKDHFAHLAHIDNNLIGYIDSEEHGIIFKVTVLTAGRYISRFYPQIDDDKRRHLIAAIDPSGEIYFARTPEEIEDIYRNGPESCMDARKASNFKALPVWPTHPYGAGDLAVAYTKNKDGRIQSRCVCWPEKKLFGRIYGDAQRMQPAMEAEGYTWMRDRNDVHGNTKLQSFIGAKLLKIPTGNADHEYVMPYFDDIKVAIDKGDYFVTAEQGEPGKTWIVSGGSANGKAVLHRMCPKINEPTLITDMRFVNGVDEEWSLTAINDHAFVCQATGTFWPHSHKVVLGNGKIWSTDYFSQHGEFCEVTGKSWPKDEMMHVGERRVHESVAHRFDDRGNQIDVPDLPSIDNIARAEAFADRMVRPRRGRLSATELVLNSSRRVA
ncbi:hypothetical protein ACTG4Q_20990 [Bradyrhizobium denitrificans]